MVSFDDLPTELLYKIAEECGPRHAAPLALVCRRFEVVSRMSTQWTLSSADDLLGFNACCYNSDHFAGLIRSVQLAPNWHIGTGAAMGIEMLLKRTKNMKSFDMLKVPASYSIMNTVLNALVLNCSNLTYLKLGSFGAERRPTLTVSAILKIIPQLRKLESFRACICGDSIRSVNANRRDSSPVSIAEADRCPPLLRNVKMRIEDVRDQDLLELSKVVFTNASTIICSILSHDLTNIFGMVVPGHSATLVTAEGLETAFGRLNPAYLRHLRIDTRPTHGTFMQGLFGQYKNLRVTGLRAKGAIEPILTLNELEHLQVWVKVVMVDRRAAGPLPTGPPMAEAQARPAEPTLAEAHGQQHDARLIAATERPALAEALMVDQERANVPGAEGPGELGAADEEDDDDDDEEDEDELRTGPPMMLPGSTNATYVMKDADRHFMINLLERLAAAGPLPSSSDDDDDDVVFVLPKLNKLQITFAPAAGGAEAMKEIADLVTKVKQARPHLSIWVA